MRAIQYLVGDATNPKAQGYRLIVHICNDLGSWGQGFVLALSRKWDAPEAAYLNWHRSQKDFQLGEIQEIPVEENLSVIHMIAQKGVTLDALGNPPIRYQALEACLTKVAEIAMERQASIHMPRIGCGLAGGHWEEIEPILARTLLIKDIPVFVYDLPQ